MKREIITEKWRKWDYIDSLGIKVWLDRYGEICRLEDENGNRIPSVGLLGFKGNEFMQAGYVWAPYVPAYETTITQEQLVSDIIKASNIISRYSEKKINSAYYVMCGIDVATELSKVVIE